MADSWSGQQLGPYEQLVGLNAQLSRVRERHIGVPVLTCPASGHYRTFFFNSVPDIVGIVDDLPFIGLVLPDEKRASSRFYIHRPSLRLRRI